MMLTRELKKTNRGPTMLKRLARPETIDLEHNRSAMVVVDMQNAFAKSDGMLDLHGGDVSAAASVIDVYTRLLREARE